jgi:hypothetical protein
VIFIIRTGVAWGGINQSVAVVRDGAWHYFDRYVRSGQGQLNPRQIRMLRRLLTDVEQSGVMGNHPPPFGCGDALRYRVDLGPFNPVSTFTDCGDPPAPLVNLVHAVMDLTAF